MTAPLIVRCALFVLAAAACVWGAATDRPLAGPAVAAAVLVGHVWTLRDPLRQLRPLLVIAVIGTAAESAWIAAGMYAPAGSMRGTVLCPLWVTAMWLNGAIFAQGVLLNRLPLRLAPLAGAIAAPLGFVAADGVGAILIAWPLAVALAALALHSAVALWLVMWYVTAAEKTFANNATTTSERRA
ncbi:MAG: DUF2878 family protein [Planctomycetales bacterium]|nr:DUF2878 family protein [Planctomycetales bacterium]